MRASLAAALRTQPTEGNDGDMQVLQKLANRRSLNQVLSTVKNVKDISEVLEEPKLPSAKDVPRWWPDPPESPTRNPLVSYGPYSTTPREHDPTRAPPSTLGPDSGAFPSIEQYYSRTMPGVPGTMPGSPRSPRLLAHDGFKCPSSAPYRPQSGATVHPRPQSEPHPHGAGPRSFPLHQMSRPTTPRAPETSPLTPHHAPRARSARSPSLSPHLPSSPMPHHAGPSEMRGEMTMTSLASGQHVVGGNPPVGGPPAPYTMPSRAVTPRDDPSRSPRRQPSRLEPSHHFGDVRSRGRIAHGTARHGRGMAWHGMPWHEPLTRTPTLAATLTATQS